MSKLLLDDFGLHGNTFFSDRDKDRTKDKDRDKDRDRKSKHHRSKRERDREREEGKVAKEKVIISVASHTFNQN